LALWVKILAYIRRVSGSNLIRLHWSALLRNFVIFITPFQHISGWHIKQMAADSFQILFQFSYVFLSFQDKLWSVESVTCETCMRKLVQCSVFCDFHILHYANLSVHESSE